MGDFVVVIEDASHAGFCGVGSAQEGGLLRDYFGQVGRPVSKAGCQGGEGVNVAAKRGVDADPISIGSDVGQLEGTEEASAPRDGGGDKSQLAKVALPGLVADPLAGGQVSEDAGQGLLPMRREFDGLSDGVDQPAKDFLSGPPAAVTFAELLEGHSFISVSFPRLRTVQHLVDG